MPAAIPVTARALGAVVLVAACCAVAACGGAPPVPPVPVAPEPDPCIVRTDSAAASEIAIAAPGDVSPDHAPEPRNDLERLAFAQMYEPLLRLDCAGRPVPGLAAAWSADASGRNWTFTLRDGARFWDGDPVTAAAVVAAWRERAGGRLPGAPTVVAAVPLDDRRLVVTLADSAAVPAALADPALAVARPRAGWAEGTGPYRPGERGELRPADASLPLLRLVAVGGDPRDALDRGVDLLLTTDPATIDYAESAAGRRVVPLPWSMTYLLLLPQGDVTEVLPADASASAERIGRDAVRAEVRPPAGPRWWAETDCPGRPVPRPEPAGDRIAYPADDPTARDLAERLVAIAPRRLVAVALSPDRFAGSLRGGLERAYVVRAPADPGLPCRAMLEWPAGVVVTPLVDVRAHALVRHGVPGFAIDDAGTIRILPPGAP